MNSGMNTRPRASLGRVLDDLGATLLDLVHGDPESTHDIGGVVIHDPTDVPIRPIGSYLPRPERPRRSGLRERILRRANDEQPPAFGHENDVGWSRPVDPAPRRRPRDLHDD